MKKNRGDENKKEKKRREGVKTIGSIREKKKNK